MLICETGQDIPDANSYVTLEEAAAYHTLYNNLDWSGNDVDLEQALILATESVDLLYGEKYLSWKHIDSITPLLFPRLWFYDNNFQIITDHMIPLCLKKAVCEVALMYYTGQDIFPTENTDGHVKIGRVKVGDIEIENQYQSSRGNVESFSGFRKIDLLLRPILKTKKKPIAMVR